MRPRTTPLPVSPETWLRQAFSSHQALEGGVVRRQACDVERIVGRDRFESYIRRRGFRAVENAGQYVVFCNRDPVRVIE